MGILLLVLKVVLVLVTIGLIVVGGSVIETYTDGWDREHERYRWKPNKRITYAIIPLVLFIGTFCISFVPANNVGIKWSMFGGTQKDTLPEGIVLKTPFDKVYTIPTVVQERTIDNVSVQTSDAQFIKMSINVKFAVNKENAYNVYKRYETIDNLKTNIISNYSQKALSMVCTEYNIVDILGEKQNEVYQKTTEKLSEMLKDEGVNLTQLTFKDLDAGKDIEDAIKAEAVAKKNVETAKQNQEEAKIKAETKKIEAQGEADANRIQTESLTQEVLIKKYIEKWNGELPKVSGSSNNMFDVSGLIK